MVYLLGIALMGNFFNLRRLQAKSKVQTEVLDAFLFADDMANGPPTEKRKCKKMRIKYLISCKQL